MPHGRPAVSVTVKGISTPCIPLVTGLERHLKVPHRHLIKRRQAGLKVPHRHLNPCPTGIQTHARQALHREPVTENQIQRSIGGSLRTDALTDPTPAVRNASFQPWSLSL